jgi:hypothetical protein
MAQQTLEPLTGYKGIQSAYDISRARSSVLGEGHGVRGSPGYPHPAS